MMDVLNNNLAIVITLSVVGVFTFIVFRNRIMVPTDQNQNTVATDLNLNTVPVDLNKLKDRLHELGVKFFSIKSDKPFEHLEPKEKDEILAEIISLVEKIAPEKASTINSVLQEKREKLDDALKSFKDSTDEVEDIDIKRDLIFSELSDLTGISFDEAVNTPLPPRPALDATQEEKTNWMLLNNFKNYLQEGRDGNYILDVFLEAKDELNTEISNIVEYIIKELL